MTATDSNVINRSELYVIGKRLPDHGVSMAEAGYRVSNDNYLVAAILVLMLIMAIITHHSRLAFIYRLKEFFADSHQFVEEKIQNSTGDIINIFLLTTILAFSLSLMLFNNMSYTQDFIPSISIPYWLFAIGYIAFVAGIYLKVWLYSLVNWVFFDYEPRRKWISGYILLTALLTYLIFPISLVDVFVEDSNIVVAICLILSLLIYEMLLLFRLFAIFKTKKYGYLLIFSYFCSVEIIPAIVLGHTLHLLNDSYLVQNFSF